MNAAFVMALASEVKADASVRILCACIHFGVADFGGAKNQVSALWMPVRTAMPPAAVTIGRRRPRRPA